MDLIIVGAGLAIIVLLGAAWKGYTGGRHRQQRGKQLQDWRANGQVWGISLEPPRRGSACSAVRRLEGHVYPIASAPKLPVPNCDRRNCHCTYFAYPERRKGDRRGRENRRESVRFDGGTERRQAGNDRRRKSDVWKSHDRYL